MLNLRKVLLETENINKLVESIIPHNIFSEKYTKYITDFNNCEISNFFDIHKELVDYNTDFYEEVLLKTKSIISNIYEEYISIKEDFDYFIKKVMDDYDSLFKELKGEYDICYKNHKKDLDENYLNDISCGIFSPNEAYSRQINAGLMDPIYSDKYYYIDRKLRFCVDNLYSYLYIKTEQILFFFFNLYENKDGNKIYLMTKYDILNKNKIFGENNFKQAEIDHLCKIFKYYKHQETLDGKIRTNLHKKEFIQNNIDIIKKFYDYLTQFNNLKNLIDKIWEYSNEIEGIKNPLGLSWFESD